MAQESKIDTTTSRDFIRALYQELLGREPDPKGLENWSAVLGNSGMQGFKETLIAFARGEEYLRRHAITSRSNNLETNHYYNFDALDANTLQALFDKTASYWRTVASTPEELYWSVLTHSKFRGVLTDAEVCEFLETGKKDLERVKDICNLAGKSLDDCRQYLEYGCGVGRLVVNLPSSIERVNCVDFSAEHLNETEKNIARINKGQQFSLYHIASIGDLSRLPKEQDIIHSFIVLQHNTPPIIEKTVSTLLSLLSINGIAILHIPIAKAYYSFDTSEYLTDETAGSSMEMHILPRANLYKLAERNGCRIIYSLCAGGCGGDIYSEIVVFKRVG